MWQFLLYYFVFIKLNDRRIIVPEESELSSDPSNI